MQVRQADSRSEPDLVEAGTEAWGKRNSGGGLSNASQADPGRRRYPSIEGANVSIRYLEWYRGSKLSSLAMETRAFF